MKIFLRVALCLVISALVFLVGRRSGADSMCRQMGMEKSRFVQGEWTCIKTTVVVMVPGPKPDTWTTVR